MNSIKRRLKGNDKLSDEEAVSSRESQSRLQKFRTFLWNASEGTILGRNAISWGKISLYYSIFYFLLGGFFVLLFAVFVTTLGKQFPTLYNVESVMDYKGVNPGLGFRPMPDFTKNTIFLDSTENREKFYKSYASYVTDFLEQNNTITNIVDCMINEASYLEDGKVCRYSYSGLVDSESHPCWISNSTMAGYDQGSPCVVIKLNRIIGWIPKSGNSTLDESLEQNRVYFKCEGYTAADVDLFPKITYYSMGTQVGNDEYGYLPYSYFPYRNVYDYIPPFVVVHFHSLPERYLLNVLCKAYAPNIDNDDRANLRGMTHLQFFYNSQTNPDKTNTKSNGDL